MRGTISYGSADRASTLTGGYRSSQMSHMEVHMLHTGQSCQAPTAYVQPTRDSMYQAVVAQLWRYQASFPFVFSV
jgi:hypothetical protein